MTGLEIALLLGLIGSAAATTAGTLYTNNKNQQLNKERWSESIELANTAHQREVADLRAAGLNPILSTGSAGAAVPSMAAAEISNPLEGLGNLGKTAGNMLLNSANTKSQVALNRANTDLAGKRNELTGMQMASMAGDVAISKLKSELADEPEVKNALRDEYLLRGAPKNTFESAYLGYRKGKDEFGKYLDDNYKDKSNGFKSFFDDVQRFVDEDRKFHYGNNKPWYRFW